MCQSGEFVSTRPNSKKRGLSRRELEVLELMAAGLVTVRSAPACSSPLSTGKDPQFQSFEKLDVKRRTWPLKGVKTGLILKVLLL